MSCNAPSPRPNEATAHFHLKGSICDASSPISSAKMPSKYSGFNDRGSGNATTRVFASLLCGCHPCFTQPVVTKSAAAMQNAMHREVRRDISIAPVSSTTFSSAMTTPSAVSLAAALAPIAASTAARRGRRPAARPPAEPVPAEHISVREALHPHASGRQASPAHGFPPRRISQTLMTCFRQSVRSGRHSRL